MHLITATNLILNSSPSRSKPPLHVISAWVSEQNLVLGQRLAEAHANEITAIPMLLEGLAREGALVTLGAMDCQKEIVVRFFE